MTSTTNVNVQLTGSLSNYYKQQMSSNGGDYETSSEYIRHLIRHDKQKKERLENEKISAMLLQSTQSPVSSIESDFFDKKREKLKNMLKKYK